MTEEYEFSGNGEVRKLSDVEVVIESELERLGLNSIHPLKLREYDSKESRQECFEALINKIGLHMRDSAGLLICEPWTNELVNIYIQAENSKEARND